MKYARITISNGYCGCNEEFYEKFEDNVDIDYLDCSEYIQGYAFLEPDESLIGEEEDYDSEEEYFEAVDAYKSEIICDIEEITKEEYERER